MKKILASLMIVAAVVATMGGNALAEGASDGAFISDWEQCTSFGINSLCFDSRTVYNMTSTSSGVVNHVQNGEMCTYIVNNSTGTVWFENCQEVHSHSVERNGVLIEKGMHFTAVVTYNGQTCTVTIDQHLANGTVQYYISDSTCA